MAELYIGLMSGTSADGIDAALVDFSSDRPAILATHYTPYSSPLQAKIISLCEKGENEIDRLGELDVLLGKTFADSVNHLLAKASLARETIIAIGCHGQTIRHRPDHPQQFTLQIGDPNTIVALTGITTVADFRRKDVALGGQGAPLVPAFHHYMLTANHTDRIVLNIGGIANVTFLARGHTHESIIGFDSGPGNVLLDTWINHHHQKSLDKDGAWARSGRIQHDLLNHLLKDPYFHLTPPKSSGREYFNFAWLNQYLTVHKTTIDPADVQATLTELTAESILTAIRPFMTQGEILVCGGGAHNTFLMERLAFHAAPRFQVTSTALYGIDPDWVEATAFAWFARQTLRGFPSNLPSVTGATKSTILGGVYFK